MPPKPNPNANPGQHGVSACFNGILDKLKGQIIDKNEIKLIDLEHYWIATCKLNAI